MYKFDASRAAAKRHAVDSLLYDLSITQYSFSTVRTNSDIIAAFALIGRWEPNRIFFHQHMLLKKHSVPSNV